ncbi:Hemolysin activation/secretion protein [Massilia sp. CF038]|nr:ShlB/FhaC/HecB family hemolysin secretion/activation protein [Massilia sp. CF038]SHH62951.1 Hemolysin activation/secretion protein [Massilia sp. CF038]
MQHVSTLRRGPASCALMLDVDGSLSRPSGRAVLALALAMLPVASAFGQANSPATAATQELLREQERARLLREQLERRPDVRLPGAAVAADVTRLAFDEKPCFTINSIVLQGDAADQFQWALEAAGMASPGKPDPALGRCLGARAIDLVVRRVQNAILARGYVTTRVLVAPQDLNGSVLTLTLIPGRLRSVRLLPGSDARANVANAVPAQPGDLLNLRDVEQALENFKRVPTADADIQIEPAADAGAGPGESDLAIKWRQERRYRISMTADDAGGDATGRYQGGVTLSLDHALGQNDLFYVSYNHDLGLASDRRGTRSRALHYSLPFGYWLVGLTASDSAYHQTVIGATQNYGYSGTSRNGDVKVSRLVYRDADSKSTLSLRAWQRASRNFIDDTEVQVQRRRMGGWEFGLEQRENFGAATLEAHLNYRRGTGAFGAERAPEELFGDGTSRFALITADANLSVPFTIGASKLRYTGAWRVQNNRTPLLAQDRFAIGGRYTVRGFDGDASLVAERGWLVRNEVGMPSGLPNTEAYVGIDHGQVSGPGIRQLPGTSLTGAVAGLRGQVRAVQFEVFVGTPLHKPDLFRTADYTVGFSMNSSF